MSASDLTAVSIGADMESIETSVKLILYILLSLGDDQYIDPLNTSIDRQSLNRCLDCFKVFRLLPKKSIDDNECNSLSIHTIVFVSKSMAKQTGSRMSL